MHVVEYSQTKFELANPLNSSKYVGITDDVENAWMDVAYRKSHLPCLHTRTIPTQDFVANTTQYPIKWSLWKTFPSCKSLPMPSKS